AAMGADVVRVDPLGGGVDAGRWPIHKGRSLYWQGLNRGKRSVTLDLRSERGREVAARLAADAGTVLTNLPARGQLAYDSLAARPLRQPPVRHVRPRLRDARRPLPDRAGAHAAPVAEPGRGHGPAIRPDRRRPGGRGGAVGAPRGDLRDARAVGGGAHARPGR